MVKSEPLIFGRAVASQPRGYHVKHVLADVVQQRPPLLRAFVCAIGRDLFFSCIPALLPFCDQTLYLRGLRAIEYKACFFVDTE